MALSHILNLAIVAQHLSDLALTTIGLLGGLAKGNEEL
jgi:hypothetical protein